MKPLKPSRLIRPNTKNLKVANETARILMEAYDKAEVDPQHTLLALNILYHNVELCLPSPIIKTKEGIAKKEEIDNLLWRYKNPICIEPETVIACQEQCEKLEQPDPKESTNRIISAILAGVTEFTASQQKKLDPEEKEQQHGK